MIRTYSELCRLSSYEERLAYLADPSLVGKETFGSNRWLNQHFYTSKEWRIARAKVISRDMGCDLGVYGMEIIGMIIVHHLNPITVKDVLEHASWILNPEYLICCSDQTHRAITYGADGVPTSVPVRKPNDTIFWERISK